VDAIVLGIDIAKKRISLSVKRLEKASPVNSTEIT
jgi:ribosomal protein S1